MLEVSSRRHLQNMGKAKRDVEFIGEDKDRQLESLWRETTIGDVLPWEDVADEAQRLLMMMMPFICSCRNKK